MGAVHCWLLLAALVVRTEGETLSSQQQPWVGTQQNYAQDANVGARDIRPHEQAPAGMPMPQASAGMPMPPPLPLSNQAAQLAYQVAPTGASIPVQPQEASADHSLMRSEAPVALDARGAQDVQSQAESYPTQHPAQYPPQQPQFQQRPGPPVYSQPAQPGAPQGYGSAQINPAYQSPYGAPQGQQGQRMGTAPRGGMNNGMAPQGYGAQGYGAPSPTPVQAMIDGACIVPVWTKGKKDYLCAEGAKTKLELKVDGEEEKLIKDGGSCTVVCPNWWMEPEPATMKCKKHEWSTAGSKVQCTVSKKVGAAFLFVLVVAVGACVYNRQHQQDKAHQLQHGHSGDSFAQPHPQAGAHPPHAAAHPPAAHPEQQPAQ